jgi:hypothetical protein
MLAAIISAVLIQAYPRLLQQLPVGGDTLAYVDIVERMRLEGPAVVFWISDRPLTMLLFFSISLLIQVPTLEAFRFIPEALVLGYMLAVLFLSRRLFAHRADKELVVALTLWIAGTSTAFLRLCLDLFSNLVGLIFALLILGLWLQVKKKSSKIETAACSVALLCLFLAHWATWVLILLLLMVDFAVTCIKDPAHRRPAFSSMLVVTLPAVTLALGILLLNLAFPLQQEVNR